MKKRTKFLKGKNNHARSIIFSESRFYEFLLDDLINLPFNEHWCADITVSDEIPLISMYISLLPKYGGSFPRCRSKLPVS